MSRTGQHKALRQRTRNEIKWIAIKQKEGTRDNKKPRGIEIKNRIRARPNFFVKRGVGLELTQPKKLIWIMFVYHRIGEE